MINLNENKTGYRSETITIHPIFNIVPMENHPFQVKDDEEMERLMESIPTMRFSISTAPTIAAIAELVNRHTISVPIPSNKWC